MKTAASFIFIVGVAVGYLVGAPNRRPAAPVDKPITQEVTSSTVTITTNVPSWSQLDSADLEQLTANLRAAGCPERTISAIIRARINAQYSRRRNELNNPLAKYWTTPAEQDAAEAALASLDKERDALLYDKLGLERPLDLYTGLTPEKQARVQEALKLYPIKKIPIEEARENPPDQAPILAARKARVQYLSQYLNEEELLSYRLNDSGAFLISGVIREIRPSEQEFLKVFQALEFENLIGQNGMFAPDVEAKLKEALGPERYAAYRATFLPEHYEIANFARWYLLSDDQVDQIRALRANAPSQKATEQFQEYRNAVSTVLNDPAATYKFFGDPFLFMRPARAQ